MSIIDLNDLLNQDAMKNAFEESQKQVTKPTFGYQKDETIYRPSHKDGKQNISVIRLLPNPYKNTIEIGDKTYEKRLNIVTFYQHNFEEGNVRINEIDPATLTMIDGELRKCPLCSHVNTMYPYSGTESDENKNNRSLRKKKRHSYVNVYVEKDMMFPENEGKVFKMKLNFELLPKVEEILSGTKVNEDEYVVKPYDLFDYSNGLKNRALLIKSEPASYNNKYSSYAKSIFQEEKPIFNGEAEKFKKAVSQCYDLWEDIVADKMKTIKSEEQMNALIQSIYGDGQLTELETEKVDDLPDLNSTPETKVEEKPEEVKEDVKSEPEKVEEPKTEDKSSDIDFEADEIDWDNI